LHVDTHAHYYPDEYFDRLSALAGKTLSSPADGPRLPFDERAGMVKEAGVDVQVLSLGSTMQYLPDLKDAQSAVRIANDVYARVISDSHGVFAAFGSVCLPNVDASLKEAAYCLDELKLVGITIGCTIGDKSPEDPAFEAFWAEMNRRKTAVFLHPVARAAEPLLKDWGLVPMVGACFEDTLSAMRIWMSGLTDRYPHVKIIIPHLGGAMPFAQYRMERRGKDGALKAFYYDSATGNPPALRCACEILGSHKIMLGTDYGGAAEGFKANVDYIHEAGLGPEVTESILGGTAAEILGLKAAVA
jgi:6-methylsalicylate decarboxylase